MYYEVTRKEISTNKVFTTNCTYEQVCNITKYPSTLYQLESITPVNKELETNTIEIVNISDITDQTENKPQEQQKPKQTRQTVNTVKELTSIIKTAKREIKKSVDTKYPRNLIYVDYEYFKKEMSQYKDSNKTTKQLYFNFLTWWSKIDKQLFPEFH